MYTPLLNLLIKGVLGNLLMQAQKAADNPRRISTAAMSMVPSSARKEQYGWLGQSPQLADITNAPMIISPLSEALYELINKTFGAAIGISRDDLSDDQVRGFLTRADGLNQMAVYLADKIGFDLLINGDVAVTNVCYDGGVFFTATHPNRGASGAQSNLVSATGATVAALATDLTSAIAAMLGMKAENGAPFHLGGSPSFEIVCPVAMAFTFKDVLNAGTNGVISQTSNVRFSDVPVGVIPSPECTANSATEWYLLRTDVPLRPIFLQEREPITPEILGPDSDIWKRERRTEYLVTRRCVGGYAHFQNAIRVA